VKQKKTFECLRCGHHYEVDYDPKEIVERSCPSCASNSVRPASAPEGAAGSTATKTPKTAER
jgi:DNA replicative helicase MCM subunit Mcm2 (Cdc46/Mcm family)